MRFAGYRLIDFLAYSPRVGQHRGELSGSWRAEECRIKVIQSTEEIVADNRIQIVADNRIQIWGRTTEESLKGIEILQSIRGRVFQFVFLDRVLNIV